MTDRGPRARSWPDFSNLPAWMDDGACKHHPHPEWWFPTVGEGHAHVTWKAIEICQSCPVREQCLEYAVTTHQNHGIWGGMFERQRRKVRREWAA